MTVLIYILFGFLVGLVAKIILGYRWGIGFIFTTIAGIIGIFLGHLIFLRGLNLYLGGWAFISIARVTIHWFWAIITSLALLFILHGSAGKRLR